MYAQVNHIGTSIVGIKASGRARKAVQGSAVT